MTLTLIACVDAENGIGKAGTLPWHVPEDMQFFRDITTFVHVASKKNAVIMGRKTWESIPEKFRPLSQRWNIVVSSTQKGEHDGAYFVPSVEAAIECAKTLDAETMFIIGGSSLYAYALEHLFVDEMYITHLSDTFACDIFFPEYNKQAFHIDTILTGSSNNIAYKILLYTNTQVAQEGA